MPKLPDWLRDGDYDHYDNDWLSNINLQLDNDNPDTYDDLLVEKLPSRAEKRNERSELWQFLLVFCFQ